MSRPWPPDRAARRAALLAAVDGIRAVLAAHAEESETQRTLARASVEALAGCGLLAMKCPAELGGAAADPVTQIEVIEATSYIDPAAGWALSIGNGTLGFFASSLPQAAIERMFADGHIPRTAGGLMPGKAVAVDGGWRVSGRWSWGSGIRHAEWVGVLTLATVAAEERPSPRIAVFPATAVTLHDNWHVAGLKGTGSCDYSVEDLFVPDAFTFAMAPWTPVRGGPLYQLGLPGFLVNELAGFALGIGRRALDTIVELSATKQRGYGKRQSLADRQVFQRAVGEGDLRLRAARALCFEVFERAWETVCGGAQPSVAQQIEMSSATTLVVDTALAVTTQAFRYGGGSAVFLHHTLQRCLRDLQVGAAHLMASDVSYERHGQCLLGMTDIDPLG